MNRAPILLVDDDPVLLGVHSVAVKQFGFRTLIAHSAEEGLDVLRRHPVSLIISDVQMPGAGGFDFVSSAKKQGMKTMPAIYLTGYDDIEILRGGLRAGGDDFVIKGRPIGWLKERVAFWTASGFQALPSSSRRRALAAFNSISGDEFLGTEDSLKRRDDILGHVIDQMYAEMSNLGPRYGEVLVERLCFLGRLSKLIHDRCRGPADFIRFPDYVFFIAKHLLPAWTQVFHVVFARFEEWSEDLRFVRAGEEPLKRIHNYDWDDDLRRYHDLIPKHQ